MNDGIEVFCYRFLHLYCSPVNMIISLLSHGHAFLFSHQENVTLK